MQYVAIAGLLILLMCAGAFGDEYTCNFDDPASADDWDLHSEGPGIAKIANGVLVLDMSAPRKDKHVWADLKIAVKLPVTVEWDQRIAHDSDHFYPGGIWLGRLDVATTQAGVTGKPMKNLVHFAGSRSEQSIKAERWYRFKMHLGADMHGTLNVTDRETGEEIASLGQYVGGLKGRIQQIGFYHNQPRDQKADAYDQDRGSSEIDNVKISAAALVRGELDAYRDQDLRGYSTREPMTFNRSTVWLGEDEGLAGTVLAYDKAAEVYLTGTRRAASWQANRLCEVRDADETTSTFVRPNDLDGPDCATVRSFQWCLRQHPVLEYSIQPRGGQCYLVVTLVCPYLGEGIHVLRTEPTDEMTQGTLDLGKVFRERGLDYHQFAEIGIAVYQDKSEGKESSAEMALKLTGPGGLVTTAPVVRTVDRARDGVDIYAVLAGADGRPAHEEAAKVVASVGGGELPMRELGRTGVFTARLKGLEQGAHTVALLATDAGAKQWENSLSVTITDGNFATWRPDRPTYQLKSGEVLPCLLGDLYAWVTMLEPASPDRRVIASTGEWNQLTDEEKARVGLIKLRTLNRAEIRKQLETHAANGIRVVRLTPNVTPQESYLDAGGHVSMHGLESLLVVLDECRRVGIRAVINLFHYPYWSSGTGQFPPWQQYVDAGYVSDRSFTDPAIRPMLKQYLRELLAFLRDDPAVLGYSVTGENDQSFGPEFINDMFDHIMACDPNHMVTQEQGGGAGQCAGGTPWGYDEFRTTKSAGLGYRTYYTAGMKSDAYFMVCGRFYGCNTPAFTAEYASGPGWYGGFAQNWTHPDFITKVRDNCWTPLLTRQTMTMSWSAPWTQEERLIPQLCAEQIDWNSMKRQRPAVGLLVDALSPERLKCLGEYEAALATLGLDYDYVWSGREPDAAGKYAAVLDARNGFAEPVLPESVLAGRPIVATGQYSVNYLLAETHDQMIAFVKNTAEYRLGPGYGRGVNELHRQREKRSELTVTLRSFPGTCRYRLYDVDERKLVREGNCGDETVIELGSTNRDYAVVVSKSR